MSPLDVRSLALFRIAIGTILICDLIERFRYIELYLVHHWNPGELSGLPDSWISFLSSAGDNVLLQQVFLAVLVVAACCYLLGYKTFLANAVTWTLLVLLHQFQPRLLNSGDKLLRLFLFWSLFLPVGKRYSLDAAALPEDSDNSTDASRLASLALMIQIVCPYVFSALFKLNSHYWREGLGLYYSFTRDDEVKTLGVLLAGLPRGLLYVMNYVVLAVELMAPLLMFSPVANSRFRQGLVIVFIGFHLGMFLTLDVGGFTFVCSAGLLALIPSSTWDRRPLPEKDFGTWFQGTADYLALAGLFLVLIWNIESLPGIAPVMPNSFRSIAMSLGLKQRFTMYSGVDGSGGWLAMPGRLSDGTLIDLFTNGEPLRREKPALVSKTFFSEHWRKLIERTVKLNDQVTMGHLADHFCQSWNSAHDGDRRLVVYGILHRKQEVQPDGSLGEPVTAHRFSRYCDTR